MGITIMQTDQRFNIRRFIFVFLVLAMAHGVSANDSVQLTDGVIVDLTGGRVYLMKPEPSVESVSIDNGEVVWTNEDAAKPLTLRENRLVTQAETIDTPNVLGLVVLDVENDGQVITSQPVTLPANVSAFVDDSITSRFNAQAVSVDQDAFVSWEYQDIPRQGMVMGIPDEDPQGGIAAPQMQSPTKGTIKLNVESGETTEVDPQDIPGAAAPPLTPPAAADPTVFMSVDGRHMLSYERIADDSAWNKYRWTIIEVGTGEEIGQIESHLSQSTFVVSEDNTLVFETGAYLRRTDAGLESEPRSVRAVDLESGNEIWSRPLRDTAYRGDFPP